MLGCGKTLKGLQSCNMKLASNPLSLKIDLNKSMLQIWVMVIKPNREIRSFLTLNIIDLGETATGDDNTIVVCVVGDLDILHIS